MLRLLLLLPLLLLLSACATSPTFNSLMLTAGTLGDTTVVTADNALKSGVISKAQAQAVADLSDKIKAALDAANTAYLASNAATANDKLAAASAAIGSLTLCLKPPITAASFDACLTAIPTGDL